MRIPFETMKKEVQRVFLKAGLSEADAEICARVHTESSCDGVYSHGLNRVSRFFDYIQKGWVDIHAKPSILQSGTCMEVWDGNRAPGILNAKASMKRAMELADQYGI